MTKKILYISGTRADYGLMRTVLKRIDQCADLELEIVVTGMHLMPEFGSSVSEIVADGFRIHEIPVVHEDDTRESMSAFIGNLIVQLTKKVTAIRPDLILLLGDRGEMLAGAVVGTYTGIPVVHIHGGEITSTVDEPVRHAITKLAHIHLPATKKSTRRIIRMGEDPAKVQVVGAPGLEPIVRGEFTPRKTLLSKYKLDPSGPILLVVQHPVSGEVNDAAAQMRTTLEAVAELGHQTLVVYPNADAGGRQMIAVIREFSRISSIQAHRNIPHSDYLGLLKFASVLVGNSSSGIIEAPSFHLPVVNIGSRQQGRERASNTLDTGYDKYDIKKAIGRAIGDREFLQKVRKGKNPYGDGTASEKIVAILNSLDTAALDTQKKNFY
ncbi:UDP-N-acetylglucosamine 2-epimerase [Methanoregula sp.]|uniref:UDP-N-acetylglucosamine 2-epimerase n=1 Tax=Methanoregula sp. TaxID=2052170 RepID=UPI003C79467E